MYINDNYFVCKYIYVTNYFLHDIIFTDCCIYDECLKLEAVRDRVTEKFEIVCNNPYVLLNNNRLKAEIYKEVQEICQIYSEN